MTVSFVSLKKDWGGGGGGVAPYIVTSMYDVLYRYRIVWGGMVQPPMLGVACHLQHACEHRTLA